MNNRFNFILPLENVRKSVLGALYALSAVMLIAAVFMFFDSGSIRRNLPAQQAGLDALKAKLSSQKIPVMPAETELAAVYRNISAVNRLSVGKTASASIVLQKLEKAVPKTINFSGINYQCAENLLRISARAGTAGQIPVFMDALEKDNFFEAVVLEKQSQKEGTYSGNTVDFTVAMEVKVR